MTNIIRTSLSDPLRIATIGVGTLGGAIGITFAPGKRQDHALSGTWRRDLALDLQAIKRWGAQYLVTLLQGHEFTELSIPTLAHDAIACGLSWLGLAIVDGEAPDEYFLDQWRRWGPTLVRDLLAGSRVVVHCKGGLGRAGTVACMLLQDAGVVQSGDEAMRMVRLARPGAIETQAQEVFIRGWRPSHERTLPYS